MASYLVAISGSDRGKEQMIPAGGDCTIGRGSQVDLKLVDATVSRRHFTILNVEGTWQLADLESASGTFVNGEQVRICTLFPGDRIRIGSTELEFTTDESRNDDASGADLAGTQDMRELENLVGRTFQGYDIDQILAAGGRSIVFRARRKKDGRITALKILKADFAQSEDDVQRFVRGINTAKEARSPCLVRLYAAGRKGRNCWVALEYVEGETLTKFITRTGTDGRLSPEETIRLGIDMAHALQSVRERQFLHRNVTPENILYDTEHGVFKLNGLMWAKALQGKWAETVTAAGQVLEDIRYCAPEQLGSVGQVDGRVDLYSLGATLYTALTGHPPFRVESLPLLSQVAAICGQTPERPGALRSDVPEDLDAAVMKLLAKHPDDRYQTPDELLADLQEMTGHEATMDHRYEGIVVIEQEPGASPRAVEVRATIASRKGRKAFHTAFMVTTMAILLIALIFVASRPTRHAKQNDSSVAGKSRLQSEKKRNGGGSTRESDSPAMSSADDLAMAQPEQPEESAGDSATAMVNNGQPQMAPPESDERNGQENPARSQAIAKISQSSAGPGDRTELDSSRTKAAIPVSGSEAAIVAFINQELRQGWTEGNVQPSPLADDAEWLRRVHLDLIGRIPASDVVEKFLADKSASKRTVMIQGLLDSEGYAQYWSIVWSNLSIGRRPGGANRAAMLSFFRNAFHQNRGWDQVVVELISAEGNNEQDGAVNFVLAEIPGAADDATEITAKTSRLLMGVHLQCTQCHNHPFNGWQQRQFWELNSFFRGLMRVDRMRNDANGMDVLDYSELISNPVDGPVFFERRNGLMEVAYPKYFGEAVELQPDSKRRSELARMMLAGEQPLIAQALVNRMWAHFFGFGFTRPIDDMGPHNPPCRPVLLNRLAAEFVHSGYDLKQLIRWIASCEAYHLTSRSSAGNNDDNPAAGSIPLFSHYYLKALSPESLCESLLVATGAGTVDWENAARNRQRLLDQFLGEYAVAEDDEATTYGGSIPQSLTLMNGDLIHEGITMRTGAFIPTLMARHKTDPERIRKLYLTILGREPDNAENAVILKHLGRRKDDAAVYQNTAWALLNSNEFAVNH